MSTLIKKATIIDSNSKHHLKKMDVLIERGTIKSIQKNIDEKASTIIEGKGLMISGGWIDIHAQFGDPGHEIREDLTTGSKAAAAGGYTTVLVSGTNHPATETKSHVEYFQQRNNSLPIEIKAIAALSEGLKGQNFVEMYDLQQTGAVAFSDGHNPISNPDLLKRALQYGKTFDAKILVYPTDPKLSHNGMMNEGPMSTQLGLKSDPSISEETMVARDIAIAEYCDAPVHFMTISSAKSVSQIKRAKKRGVKVTCDVAIANLVWNDGALEGFDSNFKVTPPLRSEKDRKALIKGVNDGTIDFVVSNHWPQNIEEKHCEFDHAGYGQSGIELCFSLYNTYLSEDISIEKWVEVVQSNPRSYFQMNIPSIEEGNKANITCFDTKESWVVTEAGWNSKSKNHPEIGKTLTGKVKKVIC